MSDTTTGLRLMVSDELLDEIALRAARKVAEQIAQAQHNTYNGYLPPAAAAHYLGVSRQRIYQLTSARILQPTAVTAAHRSTRVARSPSGESPRAGSARRRYADLLVRVR
jgi:hypothetical protein